MIPPRARFGVLAPPEEAGSHGYIGQPRSGVSDLGGENSTRRRSAEGSASRTGQGRPSMRQPPGTRSAGGAGEGLTASAAEGATSLSSKFVLVGP